MTRPLPLLASLLVVLAWTARCAPQSHPAGPYQEKPNAAQLKKLIEQLQSEKFRDREDATRQLEALGEVALPALDASLASKPQLEVRLRVEGIAERIRHSVLERAARQRSTEIHKGGIDRFLDQMVIRKELDADAAWKAVYDLAQTLAEKASKVAGREFAVPPIDYLKNPTKKDANESQYGQVRLLVPGMKKVYVVSDSLIVSSGPTNFLTSMSNCIVFVNGDFAGGCNVSNCIIVCNGNVGDFTSLENSVVIATGSLGNITRADGNFFQVKSTGRFTRCDRNIFVNQTAVEATGATENRFVQTDRGPLQSLKFFGLEVVGLAVLADGSRVESVAEGTPFAKAGIQAGDRLLTVDGANLATPDDLRRLLRSKARGDRCAVTVQRDERVLKFAIEF